MNWYKCIRCGCSLDTAGNCNNAICRIPASQQTSYQLQEKESDEKKYTYGQCSETGFITYGSCNRCGALLTTGKHCTNSVCTSHTIQPCILHEKEMKKQQVLQGWQCPICFLVYNPTCKQCLHCGTTGAQCVRGREHGNL